MMYSIGHAMDKVDFGGCGPSRWQTRPSAPRSVHNGGGVVLQPRTLTHRCNVSAWTSNGNTSSSVVL
ncbi:hypothetical protein Mapa_004175 [Marchantia paleacea]|nr:hypothetical protein Mapa_004175 [Marchantia paleacea]